jgi:hypothetical protein
MKFQGSLKDEVTMLSKYALELFSEIEDKPELMLLRMIVMKNLLNKAENDLMKSYVIDESGLKDVKNISNIINNSIQSGIIMIEKNEEK